MFLGRRRELRQDGNTRCVHVHTGVSFGRPETSATKHGTTTPPRSAKSKEKPARPEG
jgi:hypothetical protein